MNIENLEFKFLLRQSIRFFVIYFLVVEFSIAREFVIYAENNKSAHSSVSLSCSIPNDCSCVTTLGEAVKLISSDKWIKYFAEKFDKVVIKITPGYFRLTEPIVVAWGIGETYGIPLEIIGGGENTVISGAVELFNWRTLNGGEFSGRVLPLVVKNLRVADVKPYGLPLGSGPSPRGFGLPIKEVLTEIFYRDKILDVAGWPNLDYARLARPLNALSTDNKKFFVDGRNSYDWQMEPDLRVFAYWKYDWAAQSYPITIQPDGVISVDGNGAAFGIKAGQRMRIENALFELDKPGEWYLDREAGVVLLWPTDGDELNYEMSVAPSLLQIVNSIGVTVRNIAFEKNRGDAVIVQDSADVVLDSVSIRYSGNRAFVVSNSRTSGIRNALIEHNGEGGVFLSGGDRATLTPAGNFVEGSTIRDFSRISKTYRFAAELEGVGQRVERNVISDAPHSAIYFSGNEHIIAGNEIFDVVKETVDAGAIYVGRDYTARGTIIENNFFHDIRNRFNETPQDDFSRFVMGIYLDDQASGIIIKNNIFSKVQNPVHIGGGRDNVVDGNIFYESSPAIHLDSRGLSWAKKATLDPNGVYQKRLDSVPYKSPVWVRRYPTLASIRDDDICAPKYNVARGNVVVKGSPFRIVDGADNGIDLGGIKEVDDSVFVKPISSGSRQRREDFQISE